MLPTGNHFPINEINQEVSLEYAPLKIDVEEAMKHFDVLCSRFGPINASPPMTLLEVTQLAIPGLMFEIEATAAD